MGKGIMMSLNIIIQVCFCKFAGWPGAMGAADVLAVVHVPMLKNPWRIYYLTARLTFAIFKNFWFPK